MPPIIRLGDTSSHGGTIITASAKNLAANGIAVAVSQDLHACPLPGHGVTPVSSTARTTSNGRPVLTNGCVAGCGAVMNGGSATVSAT